MLEGGQLVGMRELPTRQVDLLRAGAPNPEALRKLMQTFVAELTPYKRNR
jgi:hypothetical protein